MQHADWFLVVLIILLFYWILSGIRRARRDKAVYVRRIPGIDAIDNAVGRATEMGRPIVYTSGESGVQNMELYASLGILSYIGGRAAQLGANIIATVQRPETYPMVEETLREAFRNAERLDEFREEDVRFLSSDVAVHAMMTAGVIENEEAAAAFFLGLFGYQSLLMTEPGARRGVIQIAGDTGVFQMPFFIASCDYVIIGEELFAASAYVSGDPTIKGSLVAQDRFKLLLLIVILLGVVVLSMHWSALEDSPLMQLLKRYQ
jgi:hypothetical protein